MSFHFTGTSLRPYFWGVAFISCFVTAMEVALTRYFAAASWSTYGYFIISIALFGFSISGTILTLFKDFFTRHASLFLYLIPLILMPTTIGSYLLIGLNDFNIKKSQTNRISARERIAFKMCKHIHAATRRKCLCRACN